MQWMVEHAAMLLTKCNPSSHDNRTGFERYHGKDCNERLPEFGETILYFVPKRLRRKLDARWRHGVFLGRPWNTDQNYIGTPDGSIVCSRSMVRLVDAKKMAACSPGQN